MSRRSRFLLTGVLVAGAVLFALVAYDAWHARRFVAMTAGTTELSGAAGALLITTKAVFYCGLLGVLSQFIGLAVLARQANPSRLAVLLLASAAFFVLIGPPIGAIVFYRDVRVVLPPALGVAYAGGVIPALLTSALNSLVLMGGFVRSYSIRGRLLHAFVGGICGFSMALLVLEAPDWVLLQRTGGWYDFWYTFKRSYAEFGVAGLVAGAVCSSVFNPWGQRLLQSNSAVDSNARPST
jgi:hypothetical protein